MSIYRALRAESLKVIAFTGAGGKSTAIFQLAREISKTKNVIIAPTTKLWAWQAQSADKHVIAKNAADIEKINFGSNVEIICITGALIDAKTQPISHEALIALHKKIKESKLTLLIEADGSHERPLKAPAEHEPPIPSFADAVVVVAGMSALGKALNDETVHRAEIFARLSQTPQSDNISAKSILNFIMHPHGGSKNIPIGAKRIALLNQCDTPQTQSIAGELAQSILSNYDSVLIASLHENHIQTVEKSAGIILAAGSSTRFGSPKQLLDWNGKPFVRHIAETALRSGLEPVVVVTGYSATDVESCLKDLPVKIVRNEKYKEGQSASIRAGINALPENTGSCIFLLADQPQIPSEIIRALIESHSREMQAILAPLVLEEKRANPVLFDRITFNDLLKLEGDTGGRGIFDKHRVEYLPWHDDILLFDVDKPEDYERLIHLDRD